MAQSATTGDASAYPEQSRMQNVHASEVTGWVGWIAFAGTVMLMLGFFHIIEGFVALFKDEYFLVGKSGLTINVDYTTWGWVHIIGGVLIAAAGLALFTGRIWARTIGVILAMVSAVVNISFLSAYPVWSAIMILIDLLVIWALTVHGGELRED